MRQKATLHRHFFSSDEAAKRSLPQNRYFSNSRPRAQIIPLYSLTRADLVNHPKEKFVKSAKFGSFVSSRPYILGRDKISAPGKHLNSIEILKQKNNLSLNIGALIAAPKVAKMNPLREKLIRLFNYSNIQQWKCQQLESPHQLYDPELKDDPETPSPVIKPKYYN